MSNVTKPVMRDDTGKSVAQALGNVATAINNMDKVQWGQVKGTLSNQTDLKNNLDSLQGQIDSFTALTPGSTTGDAELTNIRVDSSGHTYNTAGDAVRAIDSQVTAMKTGFDGVVYPSPAAMVQGEDQKLYNAIIGKTVPVYRPNLSHAIRWMFGTIGMDGAESSYTDRIKTDYIPVDGIASIDVSVYDGKRYSVNFYNSSKTFINQPTSGWATDYANYKIPDDIAYVRFVMSYSAGGAMNLADNRFLDTFGNYYAKDASNENLKKIIAIEDRSEISLFWRNGYIYGNGTIDESASMNAYIYVVSPQSFPFDVFVFPDIGYQINGRLYTNHNVSTTLPFTTGSFFIKANTQFTINASKVPAVTVSDVDEYATHIHIIPAVHFDQVPIVRKNTLKMAVLGDSISTYSGYSETDESLNAPYYPRGDVNSVDLTWWKIVADALHADKVSVSAISQSAYYDYGESKYPPAYTDARITRLGANGQPDIIFVAMGANDGFASQTADISFDYDVSALEELTNSTMRGIALTIRKIQTSYPSAKIVLVIPKQMKMADMPTGYTNERVNKIADYIIELGKIHGVNKVIDLRRCGINQSNTGSFCEDGVIHPNAEGMRYMAQYIISELRN